MIAALDARRKGDLKEDAFKWKTLGFLPTYASPVMDDERLYTVDNSAIVAAFDLQERQAAVGTRAWARCRRDRRCSPTASCTSARRTASSTSCGRRRPASRCSTRSGSARRRIPKPIVASPIVADGRVYVTSMEATYAIGKRVARPGSAGAKPQSAGAQATPAASASPGPVAHVQLFPYESLLAPGQKQTFQLRLFDAQRQFHSRRTAERPQPGRSISSQAPSAPTAFTSRRRRHGRLCQGDGRRRDRQARVRVIAPLPWTYDFENAAGAAAAGDAADPHGGPARRAKCFSARLRASARCSCGRATKPWAAAPRC